jgi:hypothetical protein
MSDSAGIAALPTAMQQMLCIAAALSQHEKTSRTRHFLRLFMLHDRTMFRLIIDDRI